MDQIETLHEIILSKTREVPNSFSSQEIVNLLGYDVEQQKTYGYDVATLQESEQVNKTILALLDNLHIHTYLCNFLPIKSYKVSQVNVLSADDIKEIIENGLPIFQFEYLPFALTKSQHGLFLHSSGKVLFGEKHVFYEDSLRDLVWHYYDVKTTSWTKTKFDAKSVENTLVTISTDFEVFISNLLNEKLGEDINELNRQFAT